jgi:Skp family chaperone for outer membrane proteins
MSILRCGAAAVCAAIVSVLPGQEQAVGRPVAPAGLVVGTVDIGKAFDLYPRTIKERERLQKIADGSKQQIDEITKRIEELKGSILVLAEGSFDREVKQLDLETAMQKRQGLAKMLGEQLQLEQMRMQLSIYEDLDAAIARLARDRGVHLVLRTEVKDTTATDPADKSPKTVQGRVFAFERRQVWFGAEELDLTSDLIKLLQVWPLEPAKPAPAAPLGDGKGGGDRAGSGGGQ